MIEKDKPIRGKESFHNPRGVFLNPKGTFLFYNLGAFLWFVYSDFSFEKCQTDRPEGAMQKIVTSEQILFSWFVESNCFQDTKYGFLKD